MNLNVEKGTEVTGLVQRLNEESTIRQPSDPLHWHRGSDVMSDGRQESVGPLWATSRFDGEVDGPLDLRWNVACTVAWGNLCPGVIADSTDRRGSDGPSLSPSVRKILNSFCLGVTARAMDCRASDGSS
ncbi:hypothetical protein HAX54_029651 [Datura stramonium]|uniref:Uncharacterized protein n=1 Tax=Datura stramonium TaxID=4076 RepID=A0ABS8SAE4_DATST|nr:hypothetical protein [Datura stramonium]